MVVPICLPLVHIIARTPLLSSAGEFSAEEAVATTVMIVGNSGSGKSTLGNKLLNARQGTEDDFEMYFEEGGGAAGVSTMCVSRTSKDKPCG